MIQSITFGKVLTADEDSGVYTFESPKNTFDDWHLVANERPVFAPPELKTHYVDIPGGHGVLDLSESLAGYPTYENREGSFEFKVLNDYGEWADRYSDIMAFLHGQSMKAILADDPSWFYQGRFTVSEWKAGDTWSEIKIDYNVSPFKWSCYSSVDDWLWDPFNFDIGVILKDTFSEISIDTPDSYTCPDCGADMELDGFVFVCPDCGKEVDSYTKLTFDAGLLGGVAVAPNIILTDETESGTGMDIRFVNEYLGIDVTQNFTAGTTFAPDFIFYGSELVFYFRGKGTVSIDFRIGRL